MKEKSLPRYRDFVDLVSTDLVKVLPPELKDAEVTTKLVEKLQGNSYYGIEVHPKESNISVCLDLTGAFNDVENGQPYSKVLTEIASDICGAFANCPSISNTALQSYKQMKKKLMIQVVPTLGNEEILNTIPHVEREDISIVYRFILSSDENGTSSALVTNLMLDNYHISPSQLHKDAMINSVKNYPASIRTMRDILSELIGIGPEKVPGIKKDMYIATCNQGMNGAGCIFYPGFLDQAAEKIGGDFYILPSSVHEVILVPYSKRLHASELLKLVKEVNSSEVLEQDRLTDSVYFYDSQTHCFSKVDCAA